jgi:hypothetical protein
MGLLANRQRCCLEFQQGLVNCFHEPQGNKDGVRKGSVQLLGFLFSSISIAWPWSDGEAGAQLETE